MNTILNLFVDALHSAAQWVRDGWRKLRGKDNAKPRPAPPR